MNRQNKYRKFQFQEQKIQKLEKQSDRFKRIYTEYELMSDELWDLENTNTDSIPDDFLNAIKLQTNYLEDEIEDWLSQYNEAQSSEEES